MEIFYIVVFSIVGLIVLLSLLAFLLPKNAHVEEFIVIAKTAKEIFPHINNLKKWAVWNPWNDKDPKMIQKYSGAEEGRGAVYEWEGNRQVGTGKITLIESNEFEYIRWKLEFGRSKMPTYAYFKLEEDNGRTLVKWGLDTELGNNPTARYMGVMMKKFIKQDYQNGLKKLKATVEKG